MDAKEDFTVIPLGLTFLVFSALVGCVYLRDRAKRRREDLAAADAAGAAAGALAAAAGAAGAAPPGVQGTGLTGA